MMTLYLCNSCKNQYVVEYGIIRCPHCQSKDRESQGEFGLEDINELLVQRKELMQDLFAAKKE